MRRERRGMMKAKYRGKIIGRNTLTLLPYIASPACCELEVEEMSQEEYDALPEFEGF